VCAAKARRRAEEQRASSKSVKRQRKCNRGHDEWRRRADGYYRCAVCARDRNREATRRWRKNYPDRHRERNRRWAKANPERQREIDRRARLRTRYGLDTEDYEALRRSQKGECAICREAWNLVVDHSHKQGRGVHAIRGLLCLTCNTGLGMFRDRPDLLIRGAGYLRAAWKRRGQPPAAVEESRKARGISASASIPTRELQGRTS
jgi:hypothetical protein